MSLQFYEPMGVHPFHRAHPVCDMLGEDLTHPRHLVDDIDMGQRDDSTCRGGVLGIGTHFNPAVLPWPTEALLAAGYSDTSTGKIMGGNFLRVLRETLPS